MTMTATVVEQQQQEKQSTNKQQSSQSTTTTLSSSSSLHHHRRYHPDEQSLSSSQQQQQQQRDDGNDDDESGGNHTIVQTMDEGVEEEEGEIRTVSGPDSNVLPEHQQHQVQQQIEGIAAISEMPQAAGNVAPLGVKKPKRPRRRRGGKGRWKPYHKLTFEEKIAKEEKEERNAMKRRERLFSRGKPMAPYNTTQFLLEDQEKRTMGILSDPGTATHQRQALGGGFSPTRGRFGALGQAGSEMGGNTTDTASYSGTEDDYMERQFDADYDYVNMERISHMTKDEVAREYMDLEKINDRLSDRVGILQLENDKLKLLLRVHNISYEEELPKIRRTSVSEASDAVRRSVDEAIRGSGGGVGGGGGGVGGGGCSGQ